MGYFAVTSVHLNVVEIGRFYEKNRISQNWWQGVPEFCKLQEVIWLTTKNEIFIFRPQKDLFSYNLFV